MNKKRLETAEKNVSTSFWVRAAPKSWSKYTTDTNHFFPSFERNGVIKNCVTRLIRGRKLISMTQSLLVLR